MAKTVIGLMDTPEEAQNVVRDLMDSGFSKNDIGLMASGQGNETAGGSIGESGGEMASGALKGAGTGAALGGVAGLLVGIAAIPIPGIGPIIAAGPIAAALAGAGVGAVAGGGIGALTNMGVPENEVHYYAEGVRRGGALVTVTVDNDDMADKAAETMRMYGAIDIDERAEQWRSSGWSGSPIGSEQDFQQGSQQRMQTQGSEDEQVLPVMKEELQVGKRQVERGGVRVYSHVTERPVEETVNLREEHANVERRPVNRPITADDEQAFTEQTIEVRETAEEPVVAKQARVVEEVVVSKQATERQETVRDTLRETNVEVEQAGGEAMTGRGTAANQSFYTGPERRRSSGIGYTGVERRAA